MILWLGFGILLALSVLVVGLLTLRALRRLTFQLDEQRIGAGVLDAATTHGVVATNLEGTITLFSRGAEQMLGYTAHEVVGRLRPDLFHLRGEIDARAEEMGVPPGFEVFVGIADARLPTPERWTLVHRSGRQFPVLLSLRRLTARNGHVTGCVGIFRDVSAELKVKRERDQFFSLPLEMLCIVDVAGRYLTVNHMFTVTLGWQASEMVGRSIYAFIHPDDIDATAAELGQIARGGPPTRRFTNRYRHADGSYRWLSWVSSFDSAAGRIYGAARDVTERRRLHADLERRLHFKKQLLGMVSHDLRNPISAILMTVQRLRRSSRPGSREDRAVASIEGAARRAERLVHDLLDVTQAHLNGIIEVVRQADDAVKLAREVAAEVCAAHPGRRVAVHGPDAADCEIDTHRLAQALTNLLVNALRHGDSEREVAIRIEVGPEELSVSVHNFGDPIPPEVAPVLFEAMQRRGGPDRERGSIGLGLFIVDQVARAHGGRVEVDSRPEAGTTFTMVVPRYARTCALAPPG